MKLTKHKWSRTGGWLGLITIVMGLMNLTLGSAASAQAFNTTTVQGTVYLANGHPGSGTLVVSWPSFTTASGQLVTADSTTITIAPDGFISLNLAPNLGSTPAGQYYTAVYYLSDGSTSTQYWVVPAGAQATLGQVQAQLMPSAQAVKTVSKAYVDQAISELTGSLLTASGGTLSGTLTLCCDPTQPLQAADKRYVDNTFASAIPLTGGAITGTLTAKKLGGSYQVDQFPGADFGSKLQTCVNGLSSSFGGTCDARNFTGNLAMGSNLTISTANATVLLPCATISTSNQIIVTAGTRNVSLQGCSLRGASTASGSQGGTVFLYSGTGAMVQVGDTTYATDTLGFHLDNAVINTTNTASSTTQGIAAYRTQEMDLKNLYFLGNSNQTGITLDGTGNYTGGTFQDDEFIGFQTAVNGIGHQVANSASTDWLNASSFIRLHIVCPTSGGSPINGSYGINLLQGNGNTFTGGDVESCSTALHLGPNAQDNTIVGLRNENSTNQIVADAGSSFNNWMSGGTMFTGKLTDNGTRNSFLDTFHRSFNGLNGDWYGSQKDATVTNHYRLGIGTGTERGLLNRYQTDYGYRWTTGLSDATSGEQFYQIQDELNNVNRISIGQYNNDQSNTNDQTVINSAGTGAVVLNGSNNSGTGGLVIGSGGPDATTVATINSAGNAQFNGTLLVGGTTQSAGTMTVRNNADAEVDYYLWPGLTTSKKGSYTYKDWNGSSQWYMVKDESNNWALNSATGGLDSFKAYQSTNSGDTYINASNTSGVVRVNYETGAGRAFNIYGGSSSSIYASFTGTTSIKFPGLAASSGHNCLQIDNTGFITNTGTACGTGSSNGTVNAGTSGQIAFYNGTGTAISGTNTVSVAAGGTGSSTASGALANLGGAALSGSSFTGPVSVGGAFSVANNTSIGPRYDVTNSLFGAKGDGSTDDTLAIQAAFNACWNNGASPHGGIIEFPGDHDYVVSSTINAYDGCQLEGTVGNLGGGYSPPRIMWNGSIPGSVYNITNVAVAVNSTPIYVPSSPAPAPQPYMATITASNSLSAGQWVDIEGMSSISGLGLNRGIFQVSSATSSSFTVAIPYSVTTGSYSDSGTAAVVNVIVAFDANARYEEAITNIMLANKSVTQSNTFQVGFYFGSRVDTGTRIWHGEVSGSTKYGYYFSNGGINVDFDKGWRSDGAGIAGIYWRVTGSDSFGIANGTVDNNRGAYGSASSGAAVLFDNQFACGMVNFTSKNVKVEVNTTITPGLGVFTLYDCPSAGNGEQFLLNFDTTWVVPASNGTTGFNFSSLVMSPANDKALVLSAINSQFGSGTGTNTSAAFVGIPGLSRGNILGSGGWTPLLTYSPSIASSGISPSSSASPAQILGDLNINQLWEYGIHASSLLYSDTAFTALPNATTLYTGQILAPPSYWNGANGKRYALDVVYQSGTTGTPNGGATTCSGTSGTSVLTCTSAIDLSVGQQISVGTDTNKKINYVDATQPGAVLVNLTSNLGAAHSSQALTFYAPQLASEIQMPTKTSSAPTTLAWSQGDMEENSGATANGIAAWVNISAGTPGTWAGIPLGNSSGQISSAQIDPGSLQGTDGKLLTAGTVTGAGVLLCTDSSGGATTSGCPAVSGIVGVANGGTGANSASAALINLGAVATSTTINGHALGSNVTISASDLTSGTLAHAQLPALVSGDIPNNASNTTGTASNVSGTPALPNGTTATTQSANDNSTKLATTAYVQKQTRNVNTPDWLQYLGTGADGANTTASGALSGEKFYTNFTVPYGNTVTVNSAFGLIIHATGSCTIAGIINGRGADLGGGTVYGIGGGSGGGSGGGAATGTAGAASLIAFGGPTIGAGGSAGTSSGGNGGAGNTPTASTQRAVSNAGAGTDGAYLSGGAGKQGGSSGGAFGNAGVGVILICAAITGTDGTHTGIIDVSGAYGSPAAANSTGAGSGGGGGVAILSSQGTVSTWPTIYAAGGPGGLVTVPEGLATSGSCTTQPKVTLGVSGGVLNSCAVAQAGAGCGTGTNISWNVLGGGGTGGTITPTWSGGALASCTATGGSGYTVSTYTTAGTGGDGGNGWIAEYSGW